MHIPTTILTLLLPLIGANPLPAPPTPHELHPTTIPTGITLQNFTRDCTKPETCSYNFVINYAPFGSQGCSVVDTVKVTDEKADRHAWYDVGCIENPNTWKISWGWDYKGDFAVVTVKNAPLSYAAFFGYEHPNSASRYEDQGPNAV
ncbi:hypothetical protein HYFRA_00005256, partial [Hymenoscyphus fraxineus]